MASYPGGRVGDAGGRVTDAAARSASGGAPGGGQGRDGAAPAEPSLLELRYRRLLRVLPRPYREAREQEMVDTFLDSEFGADPDNADLTAKFGGVGWGEAMSVLALALRLRWADPQAPPRFRVRAAALPLAALNCLTVLAVAAAVGMCGRLWMLLLPLGDRAQSPLEIAFGTDRGFWQSVDTWSFVLWIPALAIVLSAIRGADVIAALLSAVPALVTVIHAVQQPRIGLTGFFDWALAVVQWSVVLALITTSRTAVGRRRPPRLGYLTAALAGLVGYQLITAVAVLQPPTVVLYPLAVVFFGGTGGQTGFWFVATVVAAVTLLVRGGRGMRPATGAVLALAALGTATTILLLTALPTAWQMFAAGEPLWTALFIASVIQLALVAAITVTAGILASRRIRRLPPVRY